MSVTTLSARPNKENIVILTGKINSIGFYIKYVIEHKSKTLLKFFLKKFFLKKILKKMFASKQEKI